MNQIFRELGKTLCLALPELHAFTGCDYIFISRKGKIRPFKLLEGDENALEAFVSLGTNTEILKETIVSIETFLCATYGMKKLSVVVK